MNESTATRYQRLRRQAHVISLATGIGWLACVALTPLGGALAAGAAQLTSGWPDSVRPLVTLVVFVAILALVWEAVALPVTWQAAVRAQQLRRRQADVGALMAAQVREAVVGVALAIGGAGVLSMAVHVGGGAWWAVAGAATVPLSLAAGTLAAAALRTSGRSGLSRPDLATTIERVARHAADRPIAIHELDDEDDAAPTAAVTGLGARGSILISRVMVREWPDAEIGVIVAHELAHHVRRDLWRKAALDAVVATGALWVADWLGLVPQAGPADAAIDLATLPMLALVVWVLWFLSRPLRFAQSRAHERAADAWAVRVTGAPGALRAALRRMESRHLAEERPSRLTRWFFHRHPTVQERLTAIGESR